MPEGRLITVDGDARITRVGAVLRRTKLDELPQLINVICGTMSIVGPRPEVQKYVERYPLEVRDLVLSVRPGITDNAAVEFRNESEMLALAVDPERTYIDEILPRKLALYIAYVKDHSFLGDLRIIGRTIQAVIRG
jgi:lipopolysaccharide/colanic/teichoic acid biosynthesis glycosyltransferase